MRRSITREISQAFVLSVLLMGALGSCGREAKENENGSGEHAVAPAAPIPASTPDQPAPDTAMTDASIEGVMIAASLISIQNAQLAQSTSTNDAVKAFAAQMITDHTSVKAKTNELAGTIGVQARSGNVSQQLTSSADAKRGTWKGQAGAGFDRAYVENEIAFQQSVIDLIDNTLIPRARNTDLRAMLQSVRPSLVEHITHAKKVQAALAG